MAKALLLFSGGLDSLLAAKVLEEQKIKVVPIFFKSYFFGPEIAQKSAKAAGLKLRVVDFSEDHLKIVQKPKYGYGVALNPCIDCHLLMLKKAKEIKEKEGFDFVASGEVLGERPLSQNKKTMCLLEKESFLSGFLLRPLSAKKLPPTIPEKLGLVNREKLLDLQGRSRKKQLLLAKKYNLKEFPTPAGGCLLTDKEFGKKLKELWQKFPQAGEKDIELLKIGRHFWEGKIKIVVGRNEKENQILKKLAGKGDVLVEMTNYPGPTSLIRGTPIRDKIIERTKFLTQFYSPKARGKKDILFEIKAI